MSYTAGTDTELTWLDPPDHVPPDVVIGFDVDRDPDVQAQPLVWDPR